MFGKVDVMVVPKPVGKVEVPAKEWNMRDLISGHGHVKVARPTVVVNEDYEILAVFLTGAVLEDLRAVLEISKKAWGVFLKYLCDNHKRPGIRTFGQRLNSQHDCLGPHRARKHYPVGYYQTRSPKLAVQLWQDGESLKLLVSLASTLWKAECAAAPLKGAARLAQARASGFTGLVPGLNLEECPVGALGASKGYVSPPHNDSYASCLETIFWDSNGVPQSAGYCFAIVEAKVLFDLTADPAVMVLVPGSIRHGTPCLDKDYTGEAKGLGYVIINPAKLNTPEAMEGFEVLGGRIREGTATNPFMSGYTIRDGYNAPCEVCHRTDRGASMYLCDSCNMGFHRGCLKGEDVALPSSSETRWFCSSCRKLGAE